MLGPAVRRRMRLDRLGIRRFEAEPAGTIDRADQHLQHVKRACGLESVRMGRNPAHRVKRHRPSDEAVMPFAVHVGPGLRYLDRLFEGDAPDFGRETTYGSRRHPGFG